MQNLREPIQTVFWHRELPPLDGEAVSEHVVEGTSDRISGFIDRHGDAWHESYQSLMANATARLEQELTRLGGDCAHVLDEHIESHRDDVTDQSWLRGRFGYTLYRRAAV